MQNNRTTNILLGLIVIALIVGIWLFLADRNSASPVVQNNPTSTGNGSNNTVPPPVQNAPTPAPAAAPGMKQYSDASFGFAVSYPQSYTVASTVSGIVTFSLPGSAVPITITETTNSASDSSGKWGPYTISYANNGYVVQQQNEQDGSTVSKPITPIAYTASGLPIFNGVIPSHGWGAYDYIVALSQTKFLKISGPDVLTGAQFYDASADPTFAIAQSVTLQ